MTEEGRAAEALMKVISPKLVRRLDLTDPRDTAWEQFDMSIIVEGKERILKIRVELWNAKRDGDGSREAAPDPAAPLAKVI